VTGLQTTRLIAEREITQRVRGRATRLMTVATAVMVVAAVTIPALIRSSSSATRIGLVGGAAALAPEIERSASAARLKVALSDVADDAQAHDQLHAGTLDVAVYPTGREVRFEVETSLDPTVHAVLQTALADARLRNALARARLPVATVLAALAPVRARAVVLRPAPRDRAARTVAAIAAALLMYVSIGLYGGAVAVGVAQEKTTRTAEVLLAAVRPRQLMNGKVLGIGATGLGQLTIAVVAGLIAGAVVHSTKIPTSVWLLMPAFLVCFVAGFLLYAFAFAAAGALVARQEEVQSVSAPIAMPLLIGYLLVYIAVASPNATWVQVLSFVPPLTATLLPVRIALGHVAAWELVLCALLMVGSIIAVARLAARVYETALIQGGARVSWRAALGLRPDRRRAGAVRSDP
jgi:ABC-2 type transport system permease protein